MLTDKEKERYSRQIVMPEIGEAGQEKIKKSRVAIIGLGGLGWLTGLQLTGMGVGYLKLVDRDVVELSNIQRQLIYSEEDIGKSKAEAMAQKLQRINSDITIDPLTVSISLDSIHEVLENVDIVIDCLDNFQARKILNYGCVKGNLPLIYSAAIRSYGVVHTIIPGKSACLECIYGDIDSLEAESCAQVGVLPTILGVISSSVSHEVLNLILQNEPLLADYLLIVDMKTFSFDKIKITRNNNCKICGVNPISLQQYDKIRVESLCAKGAFMVSPSTNLKLDLNRVKDILASKFKINKSGSLFLELTYCGSISVTIVKSGSMLVKGLKDSKRSKKIYEEIMGLIKK
ncbi:MAG: HesA/MoeB/ThiF family protein [Candidatus Odinarchaeia archaeon]